MDTVSYTHLDVYKRQEKEVYALPGQDYTGTSGAQYFLPRQTTNGATYLNTGYVSEAVAKEDGLFADNPTVEITTEAAYKCFGLTLEFGRNWPDTVIFHAYYNNAAMEDYTCLLYTSWPKRQVPPWRRHLR